MHEAKDSDSWAKKAKKSTAIRRNKNQMVTKAQQIGLKEQKVGAGKLVVHL